MEAVTRMHQGRCSLPADEACWDGIGLRGSYRLSAPSILMKAAHFVFLTDIRGAVEETFDGLSTTHANGHENLMTLIFLEFEDVSLLAV